MSKFFIVSLDPAQLNDYSALAVIEYLDGEYRIVSLQRKQHLPYDQIVAWVDKVLKDPKIRLVSRPSLLIDATGVGRAIYDMMRAAGLTPHGITLTGGDNETRNGPIINVSKSRLIGKFLARWDEGKVKMPHAAGFRAMFDGELRAFRGAMSSSGRAKFEAEQGEHDDLIMSVAQAVWWAESRPKPQPRLSIPMPTPHQMIVPNWKHQGLEFYQH